MLSMMLSERRRTSVATMWKFFPASPALLASSSALKAMIFVWSATLLMMETISQIPLILLLSPLIPSIVSMFVFLISRSSFTFFCRASLPEITASRDFSARLFTSRILSPMLFASSVESCMVATISFTAAVWFWLFSALCFVASARVIVSAKRLLLMFFSFFWILFVITLNTMKNSTRLVNQPINAYLIKLL